MGKDEEKDAPTGNVGARGAKKSGRKSKGANADKNATQAQAGAQEGKMSGLDAAAKVLAEAGEGAWQYLVRSQPQRPPRSSRGRDSGPG